MNGGDGWRVCRAVAKMNIWLALGVVRIRHGAVVETPMHLVGISTRDSIAFKVHGGVDAAEQHRKNEQAAN